MITIIKIAATVNNFTLSILSLNLPTNGIMISAAMPLAINKIGSCSYDTCKLFTAKALPHGIIMKPPIDSNAVNKKPVR